MPFAKRDFVAFRCSAALFAHKRSFPQTIICIANFCKHNLRYRFSLAELLIILPQERISRKLLIDVFILPVQSWVFVLVHKIFSQINDLLGKLNIAHHRKNRDHTSKPQSLDIV